MSRDEDQHAPSKAQPMWLAGFGSEMDVHVAFRGRFRLNRNATVEIRSAGSARYVIQLDGEYAGEGPVRFVSSHIEYCAIRVDLEAGEHLIAVQVHHAGIPTQCLPDGPPFLYCDAVKEGASIPVEWKVCRLDAYESSSHRVTPILGWIEWCDTRELPDRWNDKAFDDGSWAPPATASIAPEGLKPFALGDLRRVEYRLSPIGGGTLQLSERTDQTDIPTLFLGRSLSHEEQRNAEGVWRRYDLGRVRLGRPRFTLNLSAGAVVEIASSESLHDGRVSPIINLATGPSCNLDHYVARGGVQTFEPLSPKGGRYLEIHVLGDPLSVDFVEESFVERGYFGDAVGSFRSEDALLDRIWATGVETLRACAEDAIVDNPTRERGQWIGDTVTVGLETASVAFGDLRLVRRALVQAALSARRDGLVAGLCPGNLQYLPNFACHWTGAVWRYYQLTGDVELLYTLLPFGIRNVTALGHGLRPDGLYDDPEGWMFLDWGYVRDDGGADMAFNLLHLGALRAMASWSEAIGSDAGRSFCERSVALEAAIASWLSATLCDGDYAWERAGYHVSALALTHGLLDESDTGNCVAAIKRHIQSCYPWDSSAPRLDDPSVQERRLLTPFFCHFALPPLIERGEMDFVLEVYRRCWGWALGDDRTTWLEVFDTNWSHCHHWSGCPTWQLSRYLLGLHPRFDLGRNHFAVRLRPGSVRAARGRLPLPGEDGSIRLRWEQVEGAVRYGMEVDEAITLHIPCGENKSDTCIEVEDRRTLIVPQR